MAEHLTSGPAELGAPMDYAEHDRTYSGFIALTKISILAVIDTMLALVLYSFAGGGGFWLGTLLLILTMIGVGIGIFARGTVRPLVAVTVIGFLLMAVTVG